jgi:hypothetical protein
MMKRMIHICLFLLLSAQWIGATVGDWKTFTNTKDVRQLVCRDSILWAATEGGVVRFNVNKKQFTVYTNSEGLSVNDVVAITMDQRGRVWAGLSNGDLNIYSPQQDTWALKTDYHGYVIQDLLAYGDSIFVSLSIGVSLYDSRRWEVKETYKIGDVRRVRIAQRTIWAALKNGVRRARLDFPNLIAPSAWTSYSSLSGLSQDESFAIQEFDNKIFVGTGKGISVYDGSAWLTPELKDFSISDLGLWQNKLLAVTGDGIWVRTAAGAWSRLANWINTAERVAVDGNNTIWLAVRDAGLGYYKSGDSQWTILEPNGPADNKFSALAFDLNGNLWTVSPSGGISRFDGKNWITFSNNNGKLNANDYRDVVVDNRNRVWAGSWGGGIAIIETSKDSFKISYHNSKNKRLAGIVGDANYVVVNKLVKDSKGRIWISNRQAADQRVLAVVDSLDNWQYFTTLEGIRSSFLTALTIDDRGRKWIGTENAGISVLDDKSTPFDKRDDDLSQGLGSEDGLISLQINSLASDLDGLLWMATPDGLQYWYSGNAKRPNFSIINDNVNVVAVDVRNNKWIGTVGGLTMLEADGFTRQHYSTSNSALVSDYVTCFAFDEKYGYVYIGTTNGLSRLETPYTKPASDLSLVTGYPNPFLLDGSSAIFHIDNLAEKSSMRIYTPEGQLVRYVPAEKILGSRASWDGRNDRGEFVAGGIYLFLITTESGMSKTGKVAVIRP